ncbi:MAG: winged helix-turn-helix transcriptional regulator [Fervidicoccaceae archaeon]
MLFAAIALVLALGAGALEISIDEDGLAHARLVLESSPGLNSVKLPARPLIGTMTVSIEGSETAALYDDDTRTLYFLAPSGGRAEVTYLVEISTEGLFYRFDVEDNVTFRLAAAPNVILVDVEGFLEFSRKPNGWIELLLTGPLTVKYAVRAPAPHPSPTPSPTPTVSRSSSSIALVAAIAATGGAAAYVVLKRRARGAEEEPGVELVGEALTDVDHEILKALEERGGAALQSELYKALGLPKTTVWRHVRKLERLGYVELMRRAGTSTEVRLRRTKRD